MPRRTTTLPSRWCTGDTDLWYPFFVLSEIVGPINGRLNPWRVGCLSCATDRPVVLEWHGEEQDLHEVAHVNELLRLLLEHHRLVGVQVYLTYTMCFAVC